jgi:alkanesulfonate monooxygenase SsuD/methylene tetrahydromethanopterin reductase-like flavin-dependent oxidoreductase (luciferase family)
MKVGISVPLKASTSEQIKYAQKAEELQLDHLWVSDNPIGTNAFLIIDRLAAHTSKIEFWTGITSPYYYSSSVLASLSLNLFNTHSGRFGLGVATGDLRRLKEEGILVKKPTQFMASQIKELRANWLNRSGKSNKNNMTNFQDETNGSVFPLIGLGAINPLMSALASKKADLFLLNSGNILDMQRAHHLIKKNSKHSSKGLTKLVPCIVHELLEQGEEPSSFTWNLLVQIVKSISSSILEKYGYSTSQIKQIQALPWIGSKLSPELQWLLDDFALVGSYNYCLSKMEKIAKQPIDGFYLSSIPKSSSWAFLDEVIGVVNR